jgi:hypothetical protein
MKRRGYKVIKWYASDAVVLAPRLLLSLFRRHNLIYARAEAAGGVYAITDRGEVQRSPWAR